MKAITWSVVITTRNRARMLKRCIESALQQSVPVEVVVVDEASSDDTEQVVKEFGPRVIYHRNESAVGHSKAANIGIRLASGSWIKPIDDDDYLSSDCLREMGTKLEGCFVRGENPVLISGKYIRVDEQGRYPRNPCPTHVRRRHFFAQQVSAGSDASRCCSRGFATAMCSQQRGCARRRWLE